MSTKTAGYKTPYLDDLTLCIGHTEGKRAVWQNEGGEPFSVAYDQTTQTQRFLTVDAAQIERIETPYTWESINK